MVKPVSAYRQWKDNKFASLDYVINTGTAILTLSPT